MSETRLDRLHALSVRYLADLDTARQRAEATRREQERNALTATAHKRLTEDFPATLGSVLDRGDFTGYPRATDTDPGHLACAVAYLGHGVWLRNANNRITLVRPCQCGTYREHSLTDDAQLAAAVSVGFGKERPCRHAT